MTLSLTTTASTTLTTAGTFSAFDVGSTITGAGIPAGTTITGIAGNSLSITISAQASVTAAQAVTIGNPAVPDGAYTVTVVSSGVIDAGGANYSQSIISSGSTFTVADY